MNHKKYAYADFILMKYIFESFQKIIYWFSYDKLIIIVFLFDHLLLCPKHHKIKHNEIFVVFCYHDMKCHLLTMIQNDLNRISKFSFQNYQFCNFVYKVFHCWENLFKIKIKVFTQLDSKRVS